MGRLQCMLQPVVLACLLLVAANSSHAGLGDCGQPLSVDAPTARDALYVLQASVETVSCNRCICDLNNSGSVTATDALLDLNIAVGIPIPENCPACDYSGLQCPNVAQFALFAKIRGVCTTNADCAAFSACDPSIGRCRTATDSDVGWTGLSQNADTDDPVPARVFLDCTGPAPCGDCTISGHDPSLGNCRCAGDNRTRCFTVAGPDEASCGGGLCTCYFGPPMPLSGGGTPVCVLNTLSGQPGGEVNVDEGSGTIELHLAEKIFLGESLFRPCPICVNDTTPADGMRNGACIGGINNGATCDAQAYNSTFPPPTGALYSLDCFPDPDGDISGPGLKLEIPLTTGRTELSADLPCAEDGPYADLDCPCLVCSGNPAIACHDHATCTEAGAGSCSSIGGGRQPQPNACDFGICDDIGGEQGLCADGPNSTSCDGLVRADGTGLIGCSTNDDCSEQTLGQDAGDCTLEERRPCFLDPIVSQGHAHPVVPLAAATYCSPATESDSVNIVAGLPGPGRLTLQTLVSLQCKSNAASKYTPGTGGCPAP